MATLTKLTSTLTNDADYTIYGSPASPFDVAELSQIAHRPATIFATFNNGITGAALDTEPLILDFAHETEDQLIRISVRTSSNPAPATPDRTTLIDIVVQNTDTASQVQIDVMAGIQASDEIFNIGFVTGTFNILPTCGGVWTAVETQGVTGSAVTFTITEGTRFNFVTVTQQGLRLTFGANQTTSNFARSGLTGLNILAFGTDAGNDLLFTNSFGRTDGPAYLRRSGGGELGANVTCSDNTLTIEQKVAEWILTSDNPDSNFDFVAVSGDATSIDIYAKNGTIDLTGTLEDSVNFSPTLGTAAPRVTSGTDLTITDPHLIVNRDGVRFIDTTTTVFGQFAPNTVYFSTFSTWNMDNFSMIFDAGYRFDNSRAVDCIQNWYGVKMTKAGDAQGSGSSAMFQTSVTLTCNWRNCGWDVLPNPDAETAAGADTINAIVASASSKVIILNWSDCYLNYYGNSECDFLLGFDAANSTIERFQTFSNGANTSGARRLIRTFDDVRLLEPSAVTDLGVAATQVYNPQFSAVVQPAEIFDNINFEVATNFISPNIPSYEISTFQNRNAINARLDFQQNGIPYLNNIAFQQLSNQIASEPATGKDAYGTTFSPTFTTANGDDLNGVRNEFRYGDATETIGVQVKELIEAGPLGGTSASISRFELTNNISIGTTFTIPRPHGLADVTLAAVAGVPINVGTQLEFNVGTDIAETTENMLNAVNDLATTLQIWALRTSNTAFQDEIVLGNVVGGLTSNTPTCSDLVNVITTIVETGANGAGTNTHPFNNGSVYISNTEGLLDTNTLTDNSYLPNNAGNQVGDNPGVYLVSHKSNYNGYSAAAANQAPIAVYSPDYTVYQKRNEYRPSIETYLFSNGPQIFQRIPVLDVHWEGIDTKPALKSEIVTINDIYRLVEGSDNDRTYNITAGTQPVYERIIDFNNPVTNTNLIDFQNYGVTLTTETTGTDAIVNLDADTPSIQASISSFDDSGSLSGFKTLGNLSVTGPVGAINTDVQAIFDIGQEADFFQVNINNSIITANQFASTGTMPPLFNTAVSWITGNNRFTSTNESTIVAPASITFTEVPTATNISAINGSINFLQGSIGTIVDNIKTNVINAQFINLGSIASTHTNGSWNSIVQNATNGILNNIDLNTTSTLSVSQLLAGTIITSSVNSSSAVTVASSSSDSTIILTGTANNVTAIYNNNNPGNQHDNLVQVGGIASFNSGGTSLTMGTDSLSIRQLNVNSGTLNNSSFFCTDTAILNGGNHNNLDGQASNITHSITRDSTISNSNMTAASFNLESIDGGDYTIDTSLSTTAADTMFTTNFANGRLTGDGVNASIGGDATNNPTMTVTGLLDITGSISGCPNVTAGTFNAGNVTTCTVMADDSTMINDVTGASSITIANEATTVGKVEGNSTFIAGSIGTIGDIDGGGTIVTTGTITQAASISDGILTATGDINDLADVSGGTVICGGSILEIEDISTGEIQCSGNIGNIDSATGGIIRCDGEIQFTVTPADPLLITNTTFSKLDETTRADFSLTATPAAAESTIEVTGSTGINFVRGPATGTYKIVVAAGTEEPTKDTDDGSNNTDNIIIEVEYRATINIPEGITGIFIGDNAGNATLVGSFITSPGTIVITPSLIPAGEQAIIVNQRLGFSTDPITFIAGAENTPTFTFAQAENPYPTGSIISPMTVTPTYNDRSVTDPLLTNTLLVEFATGAALLQSDVFLNQLMIEQVQQTEANVRFIANNLGETRLNSFGLASFIVCSDRVRFRVGTTGTNPVFRERTGYVRTVNSSNVQVDNNILLGGTDANAWCFPGVLEAPQTFDAAVVSDLTRQEVNIIANDQFNARGVTIGNQSSLGVLAPIDPNDTQNVDLPT